MSAGLPVVTVKPSKRGSKPQGHPNNTNTTSFLQIKWHKLWRNQFIFYLFTKSRHRTVNQVTRICRFWFVKQTFLPHNHLMWTARTSARFQANYKFIFPPQEIRRTIALRAVTNYRPETDKQTKIEFVAFVWLLSLKCHVCLSFVIKMRKMTKLRQKLQISHSDVIRALRYLFGFKKQNKISSNHSY